MFPFSVNELFEYKDGHLYWKKHYRFPHLIGKQAGSKDKYSALQYKGKKHLLHRVIFFMHHGYLPKQIDHINNNSMDNRIENLRETNESTNQQNVGLISTNKSGFKNVHWHAPSKKWVVQIHINKKIKTIGSYKDIELADLVATMAREKYHNKFANHGR